MEALAAAVASALEELPSLRRFYLLAAPVLLAAAGTLAALRSTRAVRILREQVSRLLSGLVASLLLLMVFLSALQIALRNLFDTGILWIDPLLRHCVLLLAFTGAVIATGLKRHVQINVLGRLVRGGAQRYLGAAVAAASGAICLALAHAGLELVRDEVAYGERVFLEIPSWVIAAIFPVSFTLLAFRFALLLFTELAGKAPPPGEEPPGIEEMGPGPAPDEGLEPSP